MKTENNVIKQIFNFGIGPIIGMFIGVLTVPVTTRFIPPEEYGKSSLFSLFQNIVMLVSLLALDQGYSRFYNEEENKEKLLISSALIPSIISFSLGLILIPFWKVVSNFLFGQENLYIILTLCVFFPCLIIQRFLLLKIRMDSKGKTYSVLNVIQQLFSFIVLLLFIYNNERTYQAIVLSTVFTSIFMLVITLILAKLDFAKISCVKIDNDLFKRMLLFSLPLIPSSILSWVMNSFDKVAIRYFSTFQELGLYAAAFKIVAILTMVQTIFSTAWIPIAYKWHRENKKLCYFNYANIIVMCVMIIFFLGIVFFRNFLFLFLGEDYRGTDKIFVFLMYTPVLYTMGETTGLGIVFTKKTVYILVTSIICALTNFVGNILLVPSYGAIGAAISTAICYVIYFVTRTFFSRKLWFKFSLSGYFVNIALIFIYSLNIMLFGSFIFEALLFVIGVIYNLYLCFITYRKIKNEKG